MCPSLNAYVDVLDILVLQNKRLTIKEIKNPPVIKVENKKNNNKVQTNQNSKTESKKVIYHVVKKGDTLTSIARKYSTTVQKIKTKNKLKSDNLQIGQKLTMP